MKKKTSFLSIFIGIIMITVVTACAATTPDTQEQEADIDDGSAYFFVNWQGEVFESDGAPAGIDENLDTIVWMALRSEAPVAENLPAEDNPYIAESEQVIEGSVDVSDTMWIRIVQESSEPEAGSIGQTSHKDYIFYKQDKDIYVGVQSAEDNAVWTILKMDDYGDWLEKEIEIYIRMTTGL